MAFGQFLEPLANRSERLAVRQQKVGDPQGEAQVRGLLFDAISNAPQRFAQGEKIGQNRRLRKETQEVFNAPSAKPSQNLQRLGEAAGRAGDISKASTLTEAAGSADRSEKKQKIKDLLSFGELVQSSYKTELSRTGDEDKALEKSNKLLQGLFDSGLGEDVRPALEFFANSGREIDLGSDSTKGSDFTIEATELGQAARVNKKTGKVKLLFTDDGKPVMKFVSPELQRQKTIAQKEGELGVKNSEVALKNAGYVPARLFHLNNEVFKDRIIDATDTGQPFIKLRQVPNKDVDSLTQLENVQDRLVLAVGKLKEFGIEPDPITGRIPLVGEALVELTKDPKFKEVRSEFGRILNDYRKAITGAQASFAELGQIKSTIPNLEQADLETIIRTSLSLHNEIGDKVNLSLNNLESSGFDIANLRKERKKFEVEIPTSDQKSAGKRLGGFAKDITGVISDVEKKLGRKLTEAEINILRKRQGGQ